MAICTGPFLPYGFLIFHLILSHCHDVLRVGSSPYFITHHPVVPHYLQYPSSADEFRASSFLSLLATVFGHGFRRLHFLVFVDHYKPKALELIPNRERGI
jgi:hypothetical protein